MNTLSLKKQSGAILVVSLIMLLLLTLIGVAGTQVTGLEEKMAHNSRDQNLSFQAAEAALRGAEKKIDELPSITSLNGLHNWLLTEDTTMPPLFKNSPPLTKVAWDSNDSFEFESDIEEINTQPRYFIKHIGNNDLEKINNTSYGEGNKAIISYFIVTAKGTGAQDTSQSYLRLYYARKFN